MLSPFSRAAAPRLPRRYRLVLARLFPIVFLSLLGISAAHAQSVHSAHSAQPAHSVRRRPWSHRSPANRPAPHHIVVGYLGQWSIYEHFLVKNLVTSGAASQLDQINYAQGFVTGGHCSVADPNADLNLAFSAQDSVDGRPDDPATSFHGNLHQLAELKRLHPGLKILISLEGRASDFAADAQPTARQAFVASCVDIFLRGHLAASPNVAPGTPDQPGLFDGIDLDWEYPGPENAANFVALLTGLRREMDALRPGLRLSIAVGPSPRMYPGVDLAAVSRLVDQVGVMNYDYIGPWSHTTGFLAPLYAAETAQAERGASVERSIVEFKQAGVPASRLLLGLPFYGYGWKAVNAAGNGLFQAGQGIRGDRPYSYFQTLMAPPSPPPPAPFSTPPSTPARPPLQPAPAPFRGPSNAPAQAQVLAPTPSAPTFILFRDPRSHAPWLFDGSTFWTYEDPTSIRYKAAFAVEQGMAGVMAWELSEDAPDAALLKAARSGIDKPPASTPRSTTPFVAQRSMHHESAKNTAGGN